MKSGMQLGPYEILSPLGKGGMGEVYRARDSKLDRDVAIKVLPDFYARDPERVARFQREAKVLASLNHPHIAAIYGFEESDDKRFLVMELVEGETLGERIKAGRMPVEDALSFAKQIAEGLEAAHDSGIIHRDLKPANVKVTPDGTVKVLDFGLAKALDETPSGASVSNSPTITAQHSPTAAGVILGTAPYMSPEQARGRPLDKRSDIWSFGIILYECLTGNSLFGGETASDSMGAVLHKEPDWTQLPPGTPPTIQLLLRRCLTKDRKRRLHDIADARVELEAAIVDPSSSSLGMAQAALQLERTRWPSIGQAVRVLALMVLVGALVWIFKPDGRAPGSVMRFTIAMPEEEQVSSFRLPALAISPDGTRLVYSGETDSDSQLYLRHLHQIDSLPIANTVDARMPIFSPDGQWIAFEQNDKLKRVSILGGPAVTICDAPQMRGASWGADNVIAFAPRRRSGIWRVPMAGGTPEQLTDLGPNPGPASHRWPHYLPDAKGVLFTSTNNEDTYEASKIELFVTRSKERKVLVENGTDARYIPTGHIVFIRDNVLMAASFDLDILEITGPEIPILEQVASDAGMGSGQYVVSDNGILVYISGENLSIDSVPTWVDRNGNPTPASRHARRIQSGALSPDNTQLALALTSEITADLWVLEFERDMLTRLTFDDGSELFPVWSPDGAWIYYSSDRDSGHFDVFRTRADGSGSPEQVTDSDSKPIRDDEDAQYGPADITPDGRTLILFESTGKGDDNVVLLHLGEEPRLEGFLTTTFTETHAALSPDGEWMVYVSDETGTPEVYVRRFSSGSARVKVSDGIGLGPKWSPDGNEIIYFDDDASYYSAAVSVTDGVLRTKNPRLLFTFTDTT